MPNLLEYEGSVIVPDVKPENYTQTGPARVAMGQQCFVFAPGSAHCTAGIRSTSCGRARAVNGSDQPCGDPVSHQRKGRTAIGNRPAAACLHGVYLIWSESATMEGRRNLRSVLRIFSTGCLVFVCAAGHYQQELRPRPIHSWQLYQHPRAR
ncbi:type IV secretory system conjugative DNA transfer family protein [Rhizobium beringeri]